jgi:ABC-type nitrate/sulfonate/bicarbonate transport system ATPase subunit
VLPLDEPLAALDAQTQASMQHALLRIRTETRNRGEHQSELT